jgi:hypothetical protein
MDGLIQHAGVTGTRNIATRRKWQPKEIIRATGANTPAQRGMQPMLDIAFLELTGSDEVGCLVNNSVFFFRMSIGQSLISPGAIPVEQEMIPKLDAHIMVRQWVQG